MTNPTTPPAPSTAETPRPRLPLWAHIYGAAAVVLLAACWMQLVTIAANL
ncbi:hypothetical protein [Microbacterium sp. TPU 3598]|nr:hypothetical protein [Microbacterium sp. TPU 3598]